MTDNEIPEMLTQLPEQTPRVETGPIQFGDDWPGVFIRGDRAYSVALYIDGTLEKIKNKKYEDIDWVAIEYLRSMSNLLKSCIVTPPDRRPRE